MNYTNKEIRSIRYHQTKQLELCPYCDYSIYNMSSHIKGKKHKFNVVLEELKMYNMPLDYDIESFYMKDFKCPYSDQCNC